MSNLVPIESALAAYSSKLADVLPVNGLPVEQLQRTIMFAVEQNPRLQQCDIQSLLQGAMTAAVLGLICDGPSGQGYLVPFRGKGRMRAQFVPGYKGLATLANRAGRTLEGFIVRKGDEFDFNEPGGVVVHKRKLGDEDTRDIVAAYAISKGTGLSDMVRVMSYTQLIAVRDRSPYYRATKSGPWATDFGAMARKTPMRMLSKDLPVVPLQLACALEAQHELGRYAYIGEDATSVKVETDEIPAEEAPIEQAPIEQVGPFGYEVLDKAGKPGKVFNDITTWLMYWSKLVIHENAEDYLRANETIIEAVALRHPNEKGVSALVDALTAIAE